MTAFDDIERRIVQECERHKRLGHVSVVPRDCQVCKLITGCAYHARGKTASGCSFWWPADWPGEPSAWLRDLVRQG